MRQCPTPSVDPASDAFADVLACAEARVAARVQRAMALAKRFGQGRLEPRAPGDAEELCVEHAVVAAYYDWLASEEERVLDELGGDEGDGAAP